MKTNHKFFGKSVLCFIFLQVLLSPLNNVSAFNAANQYHNETQINESSQIVIILISFALVLAAVCGFLIYKVIHLKKTNTLIGDEALVEINYAYLNLKKAYNKIKDENVELNRNIELLSGNIDELEIANCELLRQKEKLVHNENRLLELQKQKEELFSIAIHDIKNPAAAIKSYVELLEGYDLNAVEQQEIVKYLIDSTEQIINLAQSINMSVMGTDHNLEKVERKEEVSLYQMVKSIISQNIGYAKKKEVHLINKTTPDTPSIVVIKSKIEEVIFNLINNAVKFAPPGTMVFVKSYFTDKSVVLEITDTGVGISEEDVKRAFTRGGTLSSKPTGDEESSGLGLWIVKKFIEEHGGEVWLESKINVGSTFGVKLPINHTAVKV